MKKRHYHKSLMVGAICALACGNLFAQETEFDLSSQRLEIQQVLPVPGKKIDHHGIVINPTPHELTVGGNGVLDITGGVVLKDKQRKFSENLDFLTLAKKGVKLTLDFGKKAARKQGVKEVSGAYAMHIDKAGISIVGYDERGAFYGIQTLRQLLESPIVQNGELPYLDINDYPDLPNRGGSRGLLRYTVVASGTYVAD